MERPYKVLLVTMWFINLKSAVILFPLNFGFPVPFPYSGRESKFKKLETLVQDFS